MSNQDPPRPKFEFKHYQPIFILMSNRYKYLLIFIYPIPNTTREKTHQFSFLNEIARIYTTINHHAVYWREVLVITNGGGLLVFLRREEKVNIEINWRSMWHSQCGNFGDAAQQSRVEVWWTPRCRKRSLAAGWMNAEWCKEGAVQVYAVSRNANCKSETNFLLFVRYYSAPHYHPTNTRIISINCG